MQLLAAVQKEVAARGAAQEMAGILREQQNKLSALAEAQRQAVAEAATAKQRAMIEVREAGERTRTSEAQHAADLGRAMAAATREQLSSAHVQQTLAKADELANAQLEAVAFSHAEALRIKDSVIADLTSQVKGLDSRLVAAKDLARAHELERGAAMGEASAGHSACDELYVTRGTIERLATALEALERAKLEALDEADAARQEVAHKDGMLQFVEKEVHSVKVLFAEKEAALQRQMQAQVSLKCPSTRSTSDTLPSWHRRPSSAIPECQQLTGARARGFCSCYGARANGRV